MAPTVAFAPPSARRRSRPLALCAIAAMLAVLLSVQVQRSAPAKAYPTGDGYWLVGEDGGLFSFGDSQFLGSMGGRRLASPIVGIAAMPFYEGYWMAAADGGVFAFGSSGFFGSMGGQRLNAPIFNIAATPTGFGYWLVASDGGVFTFGDAGFFGSVGGQRINAVVVDIAPTPSGQGYWLVGADGGIYAFGDAGFYGSMGGSRINAPVLGMAATPSGQGYWLVGIDGAVYAFGDATFYGSMGGTPLNEPVVGIDATPSGRGYRLVATDGGVFTFGDAQYFGSKGGQHLNAPVIGIASRPAFAVKADPFANDGDSTSDWDLVADDWRLTLSNSGTGGSPAGARILGVEGLTVGDIGTVSFTLESGTCSAASPRFNLYLDFNNDGTSSPNELRQYECGDLPANMKDAPDSQGRFAPEDSATILGMDIVHDVATTVQIDDIVIDGITIRDFNTFRRV